MATDHRRPAAPEGLTVESRDVWPGFVADLAAVNGGAAEADLVLLAQVLRARDRLVEVAKKVDEDGVTVTGSQGQVRPHPLLSVERALRGEVASGFKQLGLSARDDYRVKVDSDGRLVRPGR